ncbi:MFS transporter [Clostridium tunisiense]|uniref:MFS transporter n=1 Tax=Clostridium tunisiense TaxID=219748 RepID=UPI0002F00C1B|nr:MFS transporter [Clostridium tunisiense]
MTQTAPNVKIGYKSLLSEKAYLMNLTANLISRFGDSIDSIAYGWMIYELTGSKALLAVLFGINAIPNIIFQPIAGVFVDYFKKKRIIALCDLGRGLLVLLTAFLFFTENLRPWHLIVITFCNSTLESFRGPASMAMFPYILSKEKYSLGTAFSQSTSRFVEIIGFAAAGIIIGILGISGAIIIDGVTFLICATIIVNIRYEGEIVKKKAVEYKQYFTDLKDGLKYFKNDKLIANICLFGAVFSALLVPFNSLQAAYVGEGLSQGPEIISLINIAMTMGLILGSLFYPRIAKKIKGLYLFLTSGILFGIVYIIFSILPIVNQTLLLPIITITCLFGGFVASLFMMIINVAFMTNINQEYLGRVAGLFNSMAMCSTPIASMIVASIAPFTSIMYLYAGCGILVILLFIAQIFNKHLRNL